MKPYAPPPMDLSVEAKLRGAWHMARLRDYDGDEALGPFEVWLAERAPWRWLGGPRCFDKRFDHLRHYLAAEVAA